MYLCGHKRQTKTLPEITNHPSRDVQDPYFISVYAKLCQSGSSYSYNSLRENSQMYSFYH